MSARQLVTLTATYGAGASVVAPVVAATLNVPCFDSKTPLAVADACNLPIETVEAWDERTPQVPSWLTSACTFFSGPDVS